MIAQNGRKGKHPARDGGKFLQLQAVEPDWRCQTMEERIWEAEHADGEDGAASEDGENRPVVRLPDRPVLIGKRQTPAPGEAVFHRENFSDLTKGGAAVAIAGEIRYTDEKEAERMPFQIIRGNLAGIRADAIVNTADPRPGVGCGTDGAIYAAAGHDRLLAERKKIGPIAPGQARQTPAFDLAARYVIHTVAPVWSDGSRGERETLRACYANSLALAERLGCRSVAFPLIAAGSCGFPPGEALDAALEEIGRFLLTREMTVLLVVLDRRSLELSERLVGGIEQYLSEQEARTLEEQEYGGGTRRMRFGDAARRRGPARGPEGAAPIPACLSTARPDGVESAADAPAEPGSDGLEEALGRAGETFQQRLFRLIDESGMDDVTVYKKANVDRKVFSRIRCRADYRPAKRTAVAFAIALRLDLPAARDLLARAELAFSPSSRFDLIVTYFITRGNYDIFEINAALFRYGQPTLGE